MHYIYICLGWLLLTACNQKPPIEHQLWLDCANHYRAESYQVARLTCTQAADAGFVRAAWLLGHIYYYDLNNQGNSREQGFDWYLRAAEGGWIEAQTYVGESYMYADGVQQDFTQAFHWLNKAALSHDPNAEFALGMLFFDGKGRAKDISSAIAWFKKSANKQHLMSINNLAWIHATSQHKAFRDVRQAIFWAEKLALTSAGNNQQSSIFLDTQAAAHALAKEFELAINLQNQAISYLPDTVEEDRLLEFQQHLEAYQNSKAWLENE